MRSRGRVDPIRTLDPADDAPAHRVQRLARLRGAVRRGRYRPPDLEVAEALLAWVVDPRDLGTLVPAP